MSEEELRVTCVECGADGIEDKKISNMQSRYSCSKCDHIWEDWSQDNLKRIAEYSAFKGATETDEILLLGMLIGLDAASTGNSIYGYPTSILENASKVFDEDERMYNDWLATYPVDEKERLMDARVRWLGELLVEARERYVKKYIRKEIEQHDTPDN